MRISAYLYQFTGIICVVLCLNHAQAQQIQVQLPLSLELTGACNIDISAVTGFGTHVHHSAELKAVSLGTIQITCPHAVTYVLGAGGGEHLINQQRHLRNDQHDMIPYTLWLDADTSQEWGDKGLSEVSGSYTETYPRANAFTNTGNDAVQIIPIWGSAVISNVPLGIYQDSVRVTLVW
jgi:spore coat protein U-like protein